MLAPARRDHPIFGGGGANGQPQRGTRVAAGGTPWIFLTCLGVWMFYKLCFILWLNGMNPKYLFICAAVLCCVPMGLQALKAPQELRQISLQVRPLDISPAGFFSSLTLPGTSGERDAARIDR